MDILFNTTWSGPPSGDNENDYYYIINNRGYKYYYSRITGGRVAKKQISSVFIDKVKEGKATGTNVSQLLESKTKCKDQITKLGKKITELEEKIKKINIQLEDESTSKGINIETLKQIELEETQKDEARKREYLQKCDKERRANLEKIFKLFETNAKKAPYVNVGANAYPQTNSIVTLKSLNIVTKKDWHSWLLKNHPDKGGDNDLCGRVITLGRSEGW